MSDSRETSIRLQEHPPRVPESWVTVSPYPAVDEDSRPESIRLYSSRIQQRGRTIPAADFAAELDWTTVLSALVLDRLLSEPEVIPLRWKGKAISFWGTRYRDEAGEIAVRYLFWNGVAWDWYFHHLYDLLDAHCSAAIRI